MVTMPNCPLCDKELDFFTASERGRCANCGAELDDMAIVANAALATCSAVVDMWEMPDQDEWEEILLTARRAFEIADLQRT